MMEHMYFFEFWCGETKLCTQCYCAENARIAFMYATEADVSGYDTLKLVDVEPHPGV